jgi:formamidopyrimidine-DNA glycosylase
MPELPEMENYKILLNQRIKGQTITDIQINREKSINLVPNLFINTVKHTKVTTVARRGKHLLIHLENGQVLLLHLMLGGWMFFGLETDKPKRTVQVQLSFGEYHLYFIGLRLGYLHLYSETEAKQQLAHLGPEPLTSDFSFKEFMKMISRKHGRLKTTLLDQEFIAGIGNCYSAEICFHAGILPSKDIDDIDEANREKLFHSIRIILQEGIKLGGYMDPLFKDDKLTGGYIEHCLVYDREGETCRRCGATIIMETISSRKSFFCPNCQT